MDDNDIKAALDRHWVASDANDFEAEHEIYREDAVLEYPQSRELPRVQRWPGPHVAFAFAQQMPDEHRELAGGRDSGDMLTAAGADPQEERTQRTRRSRCRPSS